MAEERNKQIVREIVRLEAEGEEIKREIEMLRKLKQESPRKILN